MMARMARARAMRGGGGIGSPLCWEALRMDLYAAIALGRRIGPKTRRRERIL